MSQNPQPLERYNEKYIPNISGMTNTGVICYLNSLLQMLMSFSVFNKYLLDNHESFEAAANEPDPKERNNIGQLYIKLLESNGLTLGGVAPRPEFTIGTSNASGIMHSMSQLRRRQKRRFNLLHHRQEDMHEALVFFIEALTDIDVELGDLFSIRYRMKLQCRKCKKEWPGSKAEPEFIFNLFEDKPILQDALTSKTAIENYIKKHITIPEDYRCENCQAVNNVVDGKVSPNIVQIYSLARVSPIFILMFDKYNKKTLKYFPPALDFQSRTGNLHYEIVAQIEHLGSRAGGHYLAKVRRPKPRNLGKFLVERRRKPLETQLEGLRIRLGRYEQKVANDRAKLAKGNSRNMTAVQRSIASLEKRTIPSVRNQIKRTEEQLAHLIKECENFEEPDIGGDEYAVFRVNDSQVGIDPNGFVPTKNTYIVAYQLIG